MNFMLIIFAGAIALLTIAQCSPIEDQLREQLKTQFQRENKEYYDSFNQLEDQKKKVAESYGIVLAKEEFDQDKQRADEILGKWVYNEETYAKLTVTELQQAQADVLAEFQGKLQKMQRELLDEIAQLKPNPLVSTEIPAPTTTTTEAPNFDPILIAQVLQQIEILIANERSEFKQLFKASEDQKIAVAKAVGKPLSEEDIAADQSDADAILGEWKFNEDDYEGLSVQDLQKKQGEIMVEFQRRVEQMQNKITREINELLTEFKNSPSETEPVPTTTTTEAPNYDPTLIEQVLQQIELLMTSEEGQYYQLYDAVESQKIAVARALGKDLTTEQINKDKQDADKILGNWKFDPEDFKGLSVQELRKREHELMKEFQVKVDQMQEKVIKEIQELQINNTAV